MKDKISFTPAQLEAIDWQKDNILVCAAAGSGKTTVLCNRIAKRVALGKCDISRILVVTFTIASADDLKVQLRKALNKEYAESSDKAVRANIRKQISLLPKARISTIHSFALEIIRKNFDRLGLGAKIRVADEWESGIIASKAMNDTIEQCYKEDADGSFARFTDLLITDRDEKLGDYFLGIYKTVANESRGCEVILDNGAMIDRWMDKRPEDSPWGRLIVKNARERISYCCDCLKQAYESYLPDSAAYKFYGVRFYEGYLLAVQLLDSLELGFESFIECLKGAKLRGFSGNPGAKAKQEQIEYYDYYKKVYGYFSKLIDDNGKKLGFSFDIENIKDDMEKSRDQLYKLYSVISLFDSKFSEEKKKRGVVDFIDIERMTHSLLVDENGNKTALAELYSREFDELYIDEYQDTNKIQDEIFRAISRKNMFIVGDIKQSIYGFRGACPEIFSRYREEGFEDGGHKIFLSENFRSDQRIVGFSNSIFSTLMSSCKTIGYGREDDLKFSKANKEKIKNHKCSVFVFCDNKNQQSQCTQAEFTASYIKSMIDGGEKPENIALLCRSLVGNGISELIEQCRKYGVELTMGDGVDFFKKPWVLLLLCILNTIDNKNKDIYVSGALRGELFGFNLDMLARIKSEFPSSAGIWYSLESYIKAKEEERIEDDIVIKGKRFFSFIERMCENESCNSVDELVRSVIYESRIIDAMSRGKSSEEGDEIRGDILRVYSYALDFASRSTMGLSSFLSHLKGIMENDKGGKKKSSPAGAVRLMTIHGSKGLQFPLCILYNSEKAFKLNPEKDCPIVYGKELGFAFKQSGQKVEEKHDTLMLSAVKQRYEDEQREEEMRLLYVAFTRAENRLVVTGKTTSEMDFNSPPPFAPSKTRIMSSNNYLEWLYTCLCEVDRDHYDLVVNPDLAASQTEIEENTLVYKDACLTDEEKARVNNVLLPYSYEKMGNIPAKAAVSSLSEGFLDQMGDLLYTGDGDMDQPSDELDGDEGKILLPSFMGGVGGDTAAKRGTATHLFMQFCSFSRCNESGVDDEIGRLVKMGYIDGETAELIDKKRLMRFFSSSLYSQILNAKRVLREQRFNIKLPAEEFTSDVERKKALVGEEILVQGVVDCVFWNDDGEIVLVDYKTDGFSSKLSPKEVKERLTERYKNQLYYYLLALERIFPNTKKRAAIYSFYLGEHFYLDI